MARYERELVTEDEIKHLEILKDALLKTIHDIDFKFSLANRICSLLLLLTGFLHILIHMFCYMLSGGFFKRGFSQEPQPLWLFLLMGRFESLMLVTQRPFFCKKKIQSGQGYWFSDISLFFCLVVILIIDSLTSFIHKIIYPNGWELSFSWVELKLVVPIRYVLKW